MLPFLYKYFSSGNMNFGYTYYFIALECDICFCLLCEVSRMKFNKHRKLGEGRCLGCFKI